MSELVLWKNKLIQTCCNIIDVLNCLIHCQFNELYIKSQNPLARKRGKDRDQYDMRDHLKNTGGITSLELSVYTKEENTVWVQYRQEESPHLNTNFIHFY